MPKRDPAILTKVSLSLPFGMGKAEWESDPAERRAAWALYVELVTRVAVQSTEGDNWIFGEALTSLYSLFESTRSILREGGPALSVSRNSVGGIAIAVLNVGLRPFLSRWHPALQAWDSTRDPTVNSIDHERKWPDAPKLKAELESLRTQLQIYAEGLGKIAGFDAT
jgi:hypothetical protein